MAKLIKSKEKITLVLTYADVWKAWCEKRHFFKSPVQVAGEKGLLALKLDKIAAIETKPTETGVDITYFLTKEAVFL